VGASHRLGELAEKWLLDLGKFGRIHDLENILHFVEEHDLFGAVDLWPVAQKAENHLFGQGGILLKELNNAVGQLWVVHAETLDLVKGNQNPSKE
jgi:hypothetical protein